MVGHTAKKQCSVALCLTPTCLTCYSNFNSPSYRITLFRITLIHIGMAFLHQGFIRENGGLSLGLGIAWLMGQALSGWGPVLEGPPLSQ